MRPRFINIAVFFHHPFFFFNAYFWERERGSERQRESMNSWAERGRESEAGSTLSAQSLMAQTHKPWDHDLSWNQMLNWLSHPGALFMFFKILPPCCMYHCGYILIIKNNSWQIKLKRPVSTLNLKWTLIHCLIIMFVTSCTPLESFWKRFKFMLLLTSKFVHKTCILLQWHKYVSIIISSVVLMLFIFALKQTYYRSLSSEELNILILKLLVCPRSKFGKWLVSGFPPHFSIPL